MRNTAKIKAIALVTMCCLPLLSPKIASAQSAEDQAAARDLFEEGMRLYNLKQYPDACPKFEASLKRYSGIGTRGKLAECYEQIGKTASAWALWSEVAAFSHKNMEPDREAYATEHANALVPKLSHLTVTVAPANKVNGLVVKRNGELVDDAAYGLSIAVDPGNVAIEASAPDHNPWTQSVSVEPQASVTVEIPLLENAPPPPPVPMPLDRPNPPHSTWQKPVGMIGVGVGAAVLVTGGIFGLVASSKWGSAFSEGCSHANNVCNTQQGFDDSHSANTFATLSNVFVIGGIVVAGAGAVLWITAPKESSDGPPRAASFGVSPMMTPGGAAISLHGSIF
jgi:hypothetical protein